MNAHCDWCGCLPARLIDTKRQRRLCGVCWHRIKVYRAVAAQAKGSYPVG